MPTSPTTTVPVKLYSSVLLLIALFLLLPDMLPMARFFLVRREAKLTGVWLPRMERRSLRIAACVLQAVMIGYVLYNTSGNTWKLYHKQQTALNGYWIVDEAQGMPAQLRWHTIVVSSLYAIQAGPDDKLNWYTTKFLPKEHAVQMLGKQDGDGAPYADLHWSDEKEDGHTLEGEWQGQPAMVKMHRVAPPSFPLSLARLPLDPGISLQSLGDEASERGEQPGVRQAVGVSFQHERA